MLKSSKISSLKNTAAVIAQCFFIASLLIFSSDVHAYGENGGSGDIYIRAKTVNILEAREEKTVEEITKFKQSGLTVQVSHPVISAVQTLNSLNNNLKDVDDNHKNRMSAVAAGAAALSLKNNYDAFNNAILAGRTDVGIENAASNAVANASNDMGGLNVSVTVGTQSNRSQVTTTESTSRGSSVSASGNAYIQSTAGDITIQGSSIKAGKDLTLDSARDLHILASKDTRESTAKRSNANGSVGLNFGSNGIGVSFSGGAGRGVGEGEDVFYNQSYVTAGNTLTLLSGGDTNIIGGIVSGDKVRAKIGGDLHIESVQDIERSKSRDYGGGATLTIGYGWFTVTANGNYDSFNNDYKSVKQQSGIFAGDQGFDVTVKGNTNLIGAVIAGSQKSINDGVNQLTTGTLTTSDLKNKAKYDATSTGMSGGYNGSFDVGSGTNTPNNGSKIDPNTGNLSPTGTGAANSWNNVSVSRPSVMGANDSSNSTTYSGISGGKITITDSAGQWALTGKTPEQAINEINRGVATGIDQSNALEKIYDEASIKASFNITQQLNTEVGIFQANRAAERAQNEAVIKELDKKGGFENLSPAEQTAYSAAQNALKDSEMWAMGGQGTLILNAISLAANGNVTGSGADLIRDSAVNYFQGLAAQQIKDLSLELGEPARAALHAIASCAGAAAKQGDCGSAALGAGASVVLNNLLDELLKTNANDMTSAEKDARVNLVTSIIAGITQAAGGDGVMANAGSRIEMENNQLSAVEIIQINQLDRWIEVEKNDAACKKNINSAECKQHVKDAMNQVIEDEFTIGKYQLAGLGLIASPQIIAACWFNPAICTELVVSTTEALAVPGASVFGGAVFVGGVVKNSDEILKAAAKYGDEVVVYSTAILKNGSTDEILTLGKNLAKGNINSIKDGMASGKDLIKKLGYDENKIHHIFQEKHMMSPLLTEYGSKEAAFIEMHKAAQIISKNPTNYKTGDWVNIAVGNLSANVKGIIINGEFRISTASMKVF